MTPLLIDGGNITLRQSSSSCPDEIDWLKIAVRDGAISIDSSLRSLLCKMSGPAALWALSWASCFSTPMTVMSSGWRIGRTRPGSVGVLETSSWENTDWNCSFRMRTLVALSPYSCPFSFKGGMPILSYHLDLTYFQNCLLSFLINLSKFIFVLS